MKKTIAIVSVLVVVFLCNFNVYADTNTGNALKSYEEIWYFPVSNSTGAIKGYYSASVFPIERILDSDVEYEYNGPNSSSTYHFSADANCKQRVSIIFSLENLNNFPVYISTDTFGISNIINVQGYQNITTGGFRYYGYDVNIDGGDFLYKSSDTNGFNYFTVYNHDFLIGSSLLIPAGEKVYISYYLDYYFFTDYYNMPLNSIYFDPIDAVLSENESNIIFNEYEGEHYTSNIPNLLSIIAKILNNQNSDYEYNTGLSNGVTSGSNALEQQSGQQHQTELSYYNQTNTALNSTGISNYSFNQEQIGGIGGVSNDFTLVFNALGSWNSVYIFSLTLALALMIIRHVRPIRRTKE